MTGSTRHEKALEGLNGKVNKCMTRRSPREMRTPRLRALGKVAETWIVRRRHCARGYRAPSKPGLSFGDSTKWVGGKETRPGSRANVSSWPCGSPWYAATALRRDVQRQLALPRWSLMADPARAGAEGLLVWEDYRSPILGSADPTGVDLTWPAFLATETNPGGGDSCPWWPSCWAAPYC